MMESHSFHISLSLYHTFDNLQAYPKQPPKVPPPQQQQVQPQRANPPPPPQPQPQPQVHVHQQSMQMSTSTGPPPVQQQPPPPPPQQTAVSVSCAPSHFVGSWNFFQIDLHVKKGNNTGIIWRVLVGS